MPVVLLMLLATAVVGFFSAALLRGAAARLLSPTNRRILAVRLALPALFPSWPGGTC